MNDMEKTTIRPYPSIWKPWEWLWRRLISLSSPHPLKRAVPEVLEQRGLIVEGNKKSIRFKDGEVWVRFSAFHCTVYPCATQSTAAVSPETYDDDGVCHVKRKDISVAWYRIKPSAFDALWDAVIIERNPLKALSKVRSKQSIFALIHKRIGGQHE